MNTLKFNETIKTLSPKFNPNDNGHIKWFLTYKLAEELADETTKGLARALMSFEPIKDEELDDRLENFFTDYTEEDIEKELIEFGFTTDYDGN